MIPIHDLSSVTDYQPMAHRCRCRIVSTTTRFWSAESQLAGDRRSMGRRSVVFLSESRVSTDVRIDCESYMPRLARPQAVTGNLRDNAMEPRSVRLRVTGRRRDSERNSSRRRAAPVAVLVRVDARTARTSRGPESNRGSEAASVITSYSVESGHNHGEPS